MKKVLLAVLVTATLSCTSEKTRIAGMDFKIIEFDSCEYILSKCPDGDFGWVFSHKGNCKFCKQRSINPINK